jgi:pimeloyl-ACP methyl ester carboxylesterase
MAKAHRTPLQVPDVVEHPVEHLERAVEHSGFDPLPPRERAPADRQWWGRHLHELRWQAELARLLVDPVYRGVGVPHGDGSPVLLVPGFLAGDETLRVLGGWLERIGYGARRSGIHLNVDCSDRALDRLERRLEDIEAETGRSVALIGHSRGAHFAKALAHRRPELTSRVISLGAGLDTPFDISVPTKVALAAVRAVHRRTTDRVARNGCLTDTCNCRFARDYAGPFPASVPLTSIYSRGDGVVWWEACLVPYAHCVEVTGSHVGLACNRKAYAAIAAALADEQIGDAGGSAAALAGDRSVAAAAG